jgi:hypothetical protein
MGWAKKVLPNFLFYHLRNIAMLPFRAEPPLMELPENMRREIQDRFRAEVNRLRELSKQPLESLGNE